MESHDGRSHLAEALWRDCLSRPHLCGTPEATTFPVSRPEGLFVCNANIECMTEVTMSARIPRELEKEVEQLMREEHLENSAALRRLVHLGLEDYRLERALRRLGEGRFSLLKAAEEAHLNVWQLLDEAACGHVA